MIFTNVMLSYIENTNVMLEYIENRGHSTKIETVNTNCKNLMEEAVEINERIRQLARKAEGPKNTNPNKIFSSTNEQRLKKLQEAEVCSLGSENTEANETVIKTQEDEVAGDTRSNFLLQTGPLDLKVWL